MDINNNQPKHKTSYAKKRLIAEAIFALSTIGLVSCAIGGVAYNKSIEDDINDLKATQTKIYETFKSTPEFDEKLKSEVKDISNAYIYGEINYDEFQSKLQQLNSEEFVKQEFDKQASENLKNEISSINNKIDKTNSTSNVVLTGFVPSFALSSMVSAVPCLIYDYKSTHKKFENDENLDKTI